MAFSSHVIVNLQNILSRLLGIRVVSAHTLYLGLSTSVEKLKKKKGLLKT